MGTIGREDEVLQMEEKPPGTEEKPAGNLPKRKSSAWLYVKDKVRLTEKNATPVKWKLIFLVFLSLFASSFTLTFLFPFLPEMILGFGYKEEDKGYYAGIVASMMFAGRACGCYFWGWLSDIKGRKPVMLISIFLSGVSALIFGFTTNIYMACITRFLTGLFNGAVGTCKTVLYEVSDNTNQAVGIAVISVAWGAGIIIGPTIGGAAGTARAVVYEISDSSNQALGITVTAVAGGLGLILGPTIGGYLASPAKRYPDTFSSEGFLVDYPYFFPGACAMALSIFAVLMDIFFLPETLNKRLARFTDAEIEADADAKIPLRQDSEPQDNMREHSRVMALSSEELYGPKAALSVENLHFESEAAFYLAKTDQDIHITSHGIEITDHHDHNHHDIRHPGTKHHVIFDTDHHHHNDHDLGTSHHDNNHHGMGRHDANQLDNTSHDDVNLKGDNQTKKQVLTSEKYEDESSKLLQLDLSRNHVINVESSPDVRHRDGIKNGGIHEEERTMNGSKDGSHVSIERTTCCQKFKNISLIELICQKDVCMAVMLYSIYSFAVIGYEEIFTVWAATERRLNGLGFEPDEIGMVLGSSSIPLLCLQFFVFPLMARTLGLKKTFIICMVAETVLVVSIPMLHLLAEKPAVLWPLLLVINAAQKLGSSLAFSATALFINNSVKPEKAGSVNGLAMTVTAISRTLAPLFGGTVYAWTVGYAMEHLGPPFDINFTFYLFNMVFWISAIIAVFVPEQLNKQKKDREEKS